MILNRDLNNEHRWPVKVFATCPPSRDANGKEYFRRIIQTALWSEDFGCTGILIYTDNGLVDPWLISQVIVANTSSIAPLVSVQPVHMHPYAAAKMVASFASLYGRRICLNIVAGAFKNDLAELDDRLSHDDRYSRLIEYALVIKRLLEGSKAVSFEGRYYRIEKLRMTPPVPSELFPPMFSSGSSLAGLEASQVIGSLPVTYPKPTDEDEDLCIENPSGFGIRIGIIARKSAGKAWEIARSRFPEDRRGQLKHQLATRVSDSVWHRQMSDYENHSVTGCYYLDPFLNYEAFCPYLVGSYKEVGTFLGNYLRLGCKAVILDVPVSREELSHIGRVLQIACASGGRP